MERRIRWPTANKRKRSNLESSKAAARQRRKIRSAAEAEALAKSTRHDDDPDRISELPNEILHHILSFLDMKHVIHTAFLSKKWTTIFKSLPTLSLDQSSYETSILGDYIYDDIHDLNFNDFMNKVLYLRDSTTPNAENYSIIRSLSISCFFENMDINHVNTWMDFAVRHNVQQLDFTIHGDHIRFHYQHCPISALSLFRWKLLTTLNWSGGHSVNIPHDLVVDLPKLKTLRLQNLNFHGETINQNFFSRCPVLETLIISECLLVDGSNLNIIIVSDQLKHLEIYSLYKDEFIYPWKPDFHVKISAPKLTSLLIRDDSNDHYFAEYLVNIHSLIKARIDLYEDVDTRDLMKLLNCICNVKSLTLSAAILQGPDGSIGNRGCLEDLLNPFHNLRVLKLLMNTSFERDQIRLIAYLLEKCPYVETLVLKMSPVRTKQPHDIVDKECGKAELSSLQFKLNQLKFIEIRGFTGYRNELEFLRFMLMHTPMLEKMVIFAHNKQPFTRNRETYRAMLEASPGRSSKTVFLFL